MKMILTLAAVAAALATASAAPAQERAGGRWEWRTAPSFGPKAPPPARVRVWVDDNGKETRMADCDCPMMKADASGCMMDMPGKGRAPSAG